MSKIGCILSVLVFTWVSSAQAMFNWWGGPEQAECNNGFCKVTFNDSKNKTYNVPADCKHLVVNNRGSGDLTIISAISPVAIDQAIVTNVGSNTLDMSSLPVKKMTLNDRSSGITMVNVAEELSGHGNGSGFIYYFGKPDMKNFETHNWKNVQPSSHSNF